MNSLITILYRTKDTFDYLDDQYVDKLDKICDWIFIILGALLGFTSFFKELEHLMGLYGNVGVIVIAIVSTLIGAGLVILAGNYVMPHLIIWIGRLLKVSAEIIDIRVVVAYSMIPNFLKIPLTIFLEANNKTEILSKSEYIIINGVYILLWVWIMKIMIQGLMKFYKYGLLKGIINASPFIIPSLIGYFIIFSRLF